MITAEEARRCSKLNSTLKEEMKYIEASIKKAIAVGNFSCTYSKYGEYSEAEIDAIIAELTNLGFKAIYDRHKQPIGCPSDQWEPYSYLKISWGENL